MSIDAVPSLTSHVDLNALFYREHSNLQYSLSHILLEEHTFDPKARILDVGCGDGRTTAEIAHRFVPKGRITGIDASPSMIILAKTVFSQSVFPNLEFLEVRVEDFSLQSEFDVIVSFSCLHWISSPQASLRRLCSRLSPIGEIMFLTYPKESAFYKFMDEALIEGFPEYRESSIYGTMLTIEGYRTALECQVDISIFEIRDLFASFQTELDLKNFIRGWLASFVQLPESMHDEFLDLVVEKSLPYRQDRGNGMINLPYTALTILGKKKA